MNYSQIPAAAYTLPVTTGLLVAYRYLWIGIAVAVIGATLLTVAKFFPRVAVEPTSKGGRHRLALTVNGRRVGEPAAPAGAAPVVPGQRVAGEDTVVLYRVA